MICQICQEREAAFERGRSSETLRICYTCITRTGLHLVEGWRLLPVYGRKEACPDCGLTQQEWLESGRYGCTACRDHFGPLLESLRQDAAGRPVALPEEADLGLALLLEDYELAARIRDRLDGGTGTG